MLVFGASSSSKSCSAALLALLPNGELLRGSVKLAVRARGGLPCGGGTRRSRADAAAVVAISRSVGTSESESSALESAHEESSWRAYDSNSERATAVRWPKRQLGRSASTQRRVLTALLLRRICRASLP